MNDVSIVVLSFNRLDELEMSLPGLCESSEKYGFEIVVVDNNSSDGSVEFLESLRESFPTLVLVLNNENLGVGGGRRVGWLRATREFILNIDDDTRITAADVGTLVNIMKSRPGIGALSPKIVHAETAASQCEHGSDRPIANFHGACHIVRGDVAKKVGDYDALCAFGGEELDYSIRIRKIGFDVRYTPAVTVQHNSLRRSGAEGAWRRSQWVFNFTRVYYKHFPWNVATTFGARSLLAHLWSSVREFGVAYSFTLFVSALKGARAGRRSYRRVSDEVLEVYMDPDLTPSYGNTPLLKKIRRRRNLVS